VNEKVSMDAEGRGPRLLLDKPYNPALV